MTTLAGAAGRGPDDLLELAVRVAGWAREGEQVEAYVARGHDTDIRIFAGEVESLSSADSAGIGVRVIAGERQGFAYAGSLDEEVVAETLAEARDNAWFASPDPHVGLASPDGVQAARLELWSEALASFPTDEKVRAALELERAVRGGDSRIRQVESATWGDAALESAVATNTGISARTRRTACYLSAYAVAGEGVDSQTGVGYTVGRSPSELDPAKASSDAVERATRLLGATKPASAHLTVVLEPRITASLLSVLGGTLDGESVLKGRSLFAQRIGESVSAPGVTLVDDPTEPDAWGATSYDAEGLATRRNVLIAEGVLQGFLYDTYSARRAQRRSTASAVRAGFKSAPGSGARALSLVPGDLESSGVLAAAGDGLLVQSVSGIHSGVNPVSGDFSVGAEGMLIRGGEIASPVREITIASTIQRMLQGVIAIGSDLEHLPSSASGVSLAIAEVSMSGT